MRVSSSSTSTQSQNGAVPTVTPDAASSPEAALRTLLAEHDVQLVVDSLGPDAQGWFGRVLGRLTAIFPAGQDPAVTLRMLQGFIAHPGFAAQA